jgi:hypothetical protein
MVSDPAFQFPPEHFAAVKDAVPLLTRSKSDVFLFFEGCGVATSVLQPVRTRFAEGSSMSKLRISEDVLARNSSASRRRSSKRPSR